MANVLVSVVLPVALGIVMLGLGLSLTVADFTRVLAYPKAVLVALTCQVVLLPVLCFLLVLAFGLGGALAVGMMLLVASPGGTTANLFSHLFGGDVALNVTLTAVNSVLAVVTLPVVVNLSLGYFVGGGAIGLQLDKVLQVIAIVLVPVAIGMLIRRLAPALTARLSLPVRIASIVVLLLAVAAAFVANADIVLNGLAVIPATLTLCVLSLLVGYYLPRLARIERPQAVASAFEIGIHNAVLAITIALSPALLSNREMAVAGAVYGLLMFLPAAAFGFLIAPRRAAITEPLSG